MPGAHSPDNDAARLRNEIHQLVLTLQQQLTYVTWAENQVTEVARLILEMRTNNDDVIVSAGYLQNQISPELEKVKSQLGRVVLSLERYRDAV